MLFPAKIQFFISIARHCDFSAFDKEEGSTTTQQEMVFYYTTVGMYFSFEDLVISYLLIINLDPNYIVYMGKDKFENEKLIEFGWPEDVWYSSILFYFILFYSILWCQKQTINIRFHVDNLSSAHVYLRLQRGQTPKGITKPNPINNFLLARIVLQFIKFDIIRYPRERPRRLRTDRKK